MNDILYRIQQIAKNEGIKITVLERVIGASKGVLSRAINNGTDIQSKWLQRIVENYPKYSEGWLLTGKGEMLKTTLTKNEDGSAVLSTDIKKNDDKQSRTFSHIDNEEIIGLKAVNNTLKVQLNDKEKEIQELSKQIGVLETKIEHLKKQTEPSFSDAAENVGCADAGQYTPSVGL